MGARLAYLFVRYPFAFGLWVLIALFLGRLGSGEKWPWRCSGGQAEIGPVRGRIWGLWFRGWVVGGWPRGLWWGWSLVEARFDGPENGTQEVEFGLYKPVDGSFGSGEWWLNYVK